MYVCIYIMISKSNNTQVPTKAIRILQNTHTKIMSKECNGGAKNLTNNSKIGSRRIFTPHFKLQVLDSYRRDSDCKGNQRATARKYNIHRRQIQKWLQCESNLRSSVANINHSGLKHQFHNVNQLQQQIPIIIPTNSNNQFGYQYYESKTSQQLPLGAARQSVATNSTTVPSMVPLANASTQGVYAATNLTAVEAVAAAAGAEGVMTFSSTSTENTSSPHCQTIVNGTEAGISSPILNSHHPIQPHHHHHHHYNTAYTHPTANISIPMPVLTHISSPHHRNYQYHNIITPHTRTLLQPQPRVSTIPSLMSSTCLPANILSTSNLSSTCSSETNIMPEETSYERCESMSSSEMRKHSMKIIVDDNVEDCCSRISTPLTKCLSSNCIEKGYENSSQNYNVKGLSISKIACLTVTPIDLSIGSRRVNEDNINLSSQHLNKTDDVTNNENGNVVDLTFRKRKIILRNEKIRNSDYSIDFFKNSNDFIESDNGHVKIKAEKTSPPEKPIKLFKPYLLDEKEDKQEESEVKVIFERSFNKNLFYENFNHKGILKTNLDSISYNNFQHSHAIEKRFQIGSAYYQGIKPLSLPSAFNMTISASSPVIPCAEGSPVSGYESSSSTNSESSYRKKFYRTEDRTCSIDLQVQALCDDLNCQKNCVQNWLNDDANANPPTTNASIILYA